MKLTDPKKALPGAAGLSGRLMSPPRIAANPPGPPPDGPLTDRLTRDENSSAKLL